MLSARSPLSEGDLMSGLLKDGLIITAVGMGLVFAALALLWGVMAAMQRLFPPGAKPLAHQWSRSQEESAPPVASAAPAPAETGTEPTAAELAAVMAALVLWREEQAAEEAIGWRLRPLLTRWLAVGRSRQVQSWSPRR
jgi:Na+-transporting methylmalonyl-CoA/oxaloacetate decarboxylase gamma subunit